tara:strand:- start:162 stop:551 length:390 start_codon:yes stop_codon:yes gene_type:complete
MAAPTPKTYTRQVSGYGIAVWNAVWTDTNNLTDSVVIDLSAQVDGRTNALIIDQIRYRCTAGIEFTLEFDATSDEFLYTSVLGDTSWVDIKFDPPLVKTAAGATGDLVLTSTSAADTDEVSLIVNYRAN